MDLSNFNSKLVYSKAQFNTDLTTKKQQKKNLI